METFINLKVLRFVKVVLCPAWEYPTERRITKRWFLGVSVRGYRPYSKSISIHVGTTCIIFILYRNQEIFLMF